MITVRLFNADLVTFMIRQIYVEAFKQPPTKVVMGQMINLGPCKLMSERSVKQTDMLLTRF